MHTTPHPNKRDERIASEFKELERQGFAVHLRKEANNTYILSAETQHQTYTGIHTTTVYLFLYEDFPEQAPDLEVWLEIDKIGADSKLRMVQVDAESETRVSWLSSDTLAEIAKDVLNVLSRTVTVKTGPSRLDAYNSDTPPTDPPDRSSEGDGESSRGVRPPYNIWAQRLVVPTLAAAATLLVVFAFAAGGSTPIWRPTPTPQPSEVGRLWEGVRARGKMAEELAQTIADLQQISALEPGSLSPFDNRSVVRHLAQAHIDLGDLLYQSWRLAEAEEHYKQVTRLQPAMKEPTARMGWVTCAMLYTTSTAESLAALIGRLEGNADAGIADPAGTTRAQWLYQAHIQLGKIHLRDGRASFTLEGQRSNADQALAQAEAALQLAPSDVAAKQLHDDALSLQRDSSNYRATISKSSDTAWDPQLWGDVLKERVLSQDANAPQDSIALIVLAPASVAVVLKDAQGIEQQPAVRGDGVLAFSIDNGQYTLTIADGSNPSDVVLEFAAKTPLYLVKVLPR